MMFKKLFGTTRHDASVRSVYEAIVAQARQQEFYADLGVPDTVSGRFDMIALHAFLVIERLNQSGETGKAYSQSLFDEMFQDMDRSLRELGVGDLSVGKRIRKMAEIFYGRAAAYREALANADDTLLAEALQRNVFDGAGSVKACRQLSGYVRDCYGDLAGLTVAQITRDGWCMPDPAKER